MKRICLNILDINAKGGEERMCTTLANSLSEVGYYVCIVSFASHRNIKPFYFLNNNVKVFHLLGRFVERRINQFFPFFNYAQYKYGSILKKNNIDVIIDVDTDRTPFSSPIAKKLNIKHIAWDHFYYGRFKNREVSKKVLPYLIHEVDKLVVLTKDDERLYVQDAKIPACKVVQIYNSSPIEENEIFEHDSKTVLAMGRLTYQKGFDILIDAWHLIADEVSDWTLKIVGDGQDRKNLQDQIDSTGLKNIILEIATKNPKEEYLNAGFFVLSSRYEGLGLVLLEAANMSLPLVSFDCDNGPREIVIDGENGFLIEPNNVQMLAEKMKLMIIDNNMRKRMSNIALSSMSKFRSEIILNQWINLIETI